MNELLELIEKMLEEQGYKNVVNFYFQADWYTKQVTYGITYSAQNKEGEFIKNLNGSLMRRLKLGEIKMVDKIDQPVVG